MNSLKIAGDDRGGQFVNVDILASQIDCGQERPADIRRGFIGELLDLVSHDATSRALP